MLAWIESVAGGRVVAADRQPGGARKEAWFIDVARLDGGRDELFLRYDRADPAVTGDPWTLHREAAVYLALQGSEVPVPRVLAVHPTFQAMLSVRLHGQNWFSRITEPSEQLATAQDFMRCLAALHQIDVRTLELPGFPAPTSIPDLVRHQLDECEAVLDHRGGDPDPALRFTLDWLRRNVPAHDGRPVLVQGDTGPGNFMYADGRVVAVVDWELAHLGDPMDDIAWLSLRAVQEPFTSLPERLSEYETLSGIAIDEDRVRYYRVLAEAKLLVMNHRPGEARPGGVSDIGNGLIYAMLHRRLWLEALADVVRLELASPEVPPDTEPGDHDWLYGAVLDELRDVVVPGIDDPLAQQRAKGVARVVKYLAQVSRHGGFYNCCELDDVERLLGTRPATVAAGRAAVAAAVRDGRVSDVDYLRYQSGRIARENELHRTASGALADRHWPALR